MVREQKMSEFAQAREASVSAIPSQVITSPQNVDLRNGALKIDL